MDAEWNDFLHAEHKRVCDQHSGMLDSFWQRHWMGITDEESKQCAELGRTLVGIEKELGIVEKQVQFDGDLG